MTSTGFHSKAGADAMFAAGETAIPSGNADHRASRPACVRRRGLQQADRGQEQEPVHGQRPQRSADRVGSALQRELPLVNVRGIRGDSGNDESTQKPDPRVQAETPALGRLLPRLADITCRTHHPAR